jgi:hypothetical protein
MVRERNIHDKINARGLAARLIDIEFPDERKSLLVVNSVLRDFDRYLEDRSGDRQDLFGMSDKYIAKKALGFVHRNRADFFGDSYLEERFLGDFLPKSLHTSCERLCNGDSEVADCVGFSSLVSVLLESKGLDVLTIIYDKHIGLELRTGSELMPLETTSPFGHGVSGNTRRIGYVDLSSVVANSYGVHINKVSCRQESMRHCDKAIFLDKKNSSAYYNRALLHGENGDKGLAMKDYDKAIFLDKKNSSAHNNRAVLHAENGNKELAMKGYNSAIFWDKKYPSAYKNRAILNAKNENLSSSLSDFKVYASFSEENAEEVGDVIKCLERHAAD